jgi:hypothetical protein
MSFHSPSFSRNLAPVIFSLFSNVKGSPVLTHLARRTLKTTLCRWKDGRCLQPTAGTKQKVRGEIIRNNHPLAITIVILFTVSHLLLMSQRSCKVSGEPNYVEGVVVLCFRPTSTLHMYIHTFLSLMFWYNIWHRRWAVFCLFLYFLFSAEICIILHAVVYSLTYSYMHY